ncbi:hypothetical protein Ciccas_010352 [Cichlidogyrus casuarinus]|uniref:Uncharacterized protein n=1 Tax=Cichlidogyrus casuarinus TaxID=1844966 RepID=A0ABD2PUC7_9PLAT
MDLVFRELRKRQGIEDSARHSSATVIQSRQERNFLLIVERGDVAGLKRFLDANPNFDINCTDPLGRTGLISAIENEHNEIVKLLLDRGIEVKDGLLHAINEENIEAIELILTTDKAGNRTKTKLISSNLARIDNNIGMDENHLIFMSSGGLDSVEFSS